MSDDGPPADAGATAPGDGSNAGGAARPRPVPGTRAARAPDPDADAVGRDRGQSELIGFVLSFSMIILSVGLVYTVGLGALEDVRDGERLNSAERTLEGLAATYENLQRGDPARASEIRLSGGGLRVADDTELTVEVDAGGSTVSETIEPRSLIFTANDGRVSFVGGAVFRVDSNGGLVVVHEPRVACTSDRAIVSVPTLNLSDGAVGGDSSVVVKARLNETTLVYPQDTETLPSDATEVRVTVDSSPDATGWERVLTGGGWSKSGNTYACTTDKVIVRTVALDLDFLI